MLFFRISIKNFYHRLSISKVISSCYLTGVHGSRTPIFLEKKMKPVGLLFVVLSFFVTGCANKTIPLDTQRLKKTAPESVAAVQSAKKGPFLAMTAGKALFGAVGAAAMIADGNRIVKKYNVENPTNYLSREMAMALSDRVPGLQYEASDEFTDEGRINELFKIYG